MVEGGKAMHLDIPVIPLKPCSSSIIPSSSLHLPISVDHTSSVCRTGGHSHSEVCKTLESVNGTEAKREHGWFSDVVFGSVPSQIEVGNAIDSLQKFMKRNFSSELEPHPIVAFTDLSISLYRGCGRVYNALSLIQTEPSVMKLVVSLSTDKAVWEAIMNNESVQKLRESFNPGEKGRPYGYNEESDLASSIWGWIFELAVSKVMLFMEKFTLLMRKKFQPHGSEHQTAVRKDELEELVSSSLLLSVVIFWIVVVARANGF